MTKFKPGAHVRPNERKNFYGLDGKLCGSVPAFEPFIIIGYEVMTLMILQVTGIGGLMTTLAEPADVDVIKTCPIILWRGQVGFIVPSTGHDLEAV